MNLALTLMLAFMFGLGLFTLALGVRGVERYEKVEDPAESKDSVKEYARKVGPPILAFVLALLFTGVVGDTPWVSLAIFAAGAAYVVPQNTAQRKEQEAYLERTIAMSEWVQQLRDSIVSGAGIEEPLRETARNGPESLRRDLRVLAGELTTFDAAEALERFAARTEHHTADMLAATYAVAATESVKDLPGLLAEIAEFARNEVETLKNAASQRKRIRKNSRLILGVLGGLVGTGFVFLGPLLAFYDTAVGQLTLAVLGAATLGIVRLQGKLSMMESPPRFFPSDVDAADLDEFNLEEEQYA